MVWRLTLSRKITRIVYGILKESRHQACKLKKAANVNYWYSISPHVTVEYMSGIKYAGPHSIRKNLDTLEEIQGKAT